MNNMRAIIITATALLLGACATQPNLTPTAEFAPVQPLPAAPKAAATGAIFDNGMGLFGDLRTYQGGEMQVGDLITVLLSETTQASRTSDITTSRAATNDVVTVAQRTLYWIRSVAAPDSLATLNSTAAPSAVMVLAQQTRRPH